MSTKKVLTRQCKKASCATKKAFQAICITNRIKGTANNQGNFGRTISGGCHELTSFNSVDHFILSMICAFLGLFV